MTLYREMLVASRESGGAEGRARGNPRDRLNSLLLSVWAERVNQTTRSSSGFSARAATGPGLSGLPPDTLRRITAESDQLSVQLGTLSSVSNPAASRLRTDCAARFRGAVPRGQRAYFDQYLSRAPSMPR